jgi:tRNA A37 methylthiotransferase MiaB
MPLKDLTISADTDNLVDHAAAKRPARPIAAPKAAPTKVGFVSLGCPKNLVDSEVMMGLLARAGAELTTQAEDADVIVVNTCSFIESAQQESVNTILEMAGHKNGGRAKKLVVAGCLWRDSEIRSAKTFPKSMPWLGPANWKTFWPQPESRPRHRRGPILRL